MRLSVLYESNDFLAINKPCELAMHKDANYPSIMQWMAGHGFTDLFPCHRLDTPTSGCLLFAKNAHSANAIRLEFEDQRIEKIYLAISDKKPRKKQGTISGDMQKGRNGSYLLTRENHNPAVTKFFSISHSRGKRLYVCYPRTGRTHQIRVALKSIGAPILGDARYKGTQSDRLYLHSYKLMVTLPNERINLCCLPEDGRYFSKDHLQPLLSLFEQAET